MITLLEKIYIRIFTIPRDLLRALRAFWTKIYNILFKYILDKTLLLLLFISKHEYKYQTVDKPIISVVCHRDVTAYLIAVKTLIYHSRKNFIFYAVNDNSLTRSDKRFISSHHNIKVIDISEKIKKNNFIFNFYFQNAKYFWINQAFSYKKIYYMDCDIIFFRNPEFFINNKFDIVYMEDYLSRYSFSECELIHYLNLRPMDKVNVGMFSLPSKHISKELIKELIKMKDEVILSRFIEEFFFEQTAYALLFAKLKKKGLSVSKLPKEYFLLARNKFSNTKIPENPVCFHYTSCLTGLRQLDSLKVLYKTFLFRK
jgi:hypothetical protein